MRRPSSQAQRRLGDRVHDEFEKSVRVPSGVRLALAGVIGFAGIAFFFLGFAISTMTLSSTGPVPHPVGAQAAALMMVAMGCAFIFVGWRLLQARKPNDRLFGHWARTVFGVCLAMSAGGMAWSFFAAPTFGIGVGALVNGGWAAALLYSTLSQRQAARDAIRKPSAHLPSLG